MSLPSGLSALTETPLCSREEAVRELTAPGQPFALDQREVEGARCRVFVHAPRTIRDLLERAHDAFGDHVYLQYEDERLTFAEVRCRAARLAWVLRERYGVARGDRVAIVLRNYPEWVIAFYAVINLGGIVAALNAWWTGPELAGALAHSGVRVAFVDAERAERLRDTHGAAGVATIAVRAPLEAGDSFEGVIAAELRNAPPPATLDADDPVLVMYTSGTTGAPKGAVLTQRGAIHALFSWQLDAAVNAKRGGWTDPDEPHAEQRSLLLSVPLFHVSGSHVGMLGCLLMGRRLVLMYKWDPVRAVELVEREHISLFIAPAAITGDLVRTAAAMGRDMSSLLLVGGGGAARSPDQVRAIASAGAAPNIGWGMTETNAIGAALTWAEYAAHPTSAGYCSSVLDMRIVDLGGHALPPGEAGELQVRGTTLFKGYWNASEATAAAHLDGWFKRATSRASTRRVAFTSSAGLRTW